MEGTLLELEENSQFEAILEQARVGEETAWVELYSALAPSLYAFARARGASDADEIVGDTFYRVAKDINSFSGGWNQFRAWSHTIAYHRIVDARRKHTRRKTEPVEPQTLADAGDAGNVEDDALANLTLEELRATLSHLTDDQQDILVLRFIVGLSIEEAAEATGKSPGSVKSLQHRALNALRKHLDFTGSVTR